MFRAMLAGIILSATFGAAAYGQELDITSNRSQLKIVNIGTKNIEIRDITINGRDDCTEKKSETQLTPEEQHKVWFGGREAKKLNSGGKHHTDLCPGGDCSGCGNPAQEPCEQTYDIISVTKILKVGDESIWYATCAANIIFVTVTTDRGTTPYRFK